MPLDTLQEATSNGINIAPDDTLQEPTGDDSAQQVATLRQEATSVSSITTKALQEPTSELYQATSEQVLPLPDAQYTSQSLTPQLLATPEKNICGNGG